MKFRNTRNQLITRNLFLEESANLDQVMYTLNRESVCDYPSIYRLYIDEEDFTEYNFALKYFESYAHWKQICTCNWFIPYISAWREELELKVKARNLKSLILKAEKDPAIAKYLLNNHWVEKAQANNPVNNLRGRPSKEEIKGHLKLITNEEMMIEEHYERMKKG